MTNVSHQPSAISSQQTAVTPQPLHPSPFTPYHGSPARQGGEEVERTPKGSSQRPRPSGRGTGFTLHPERGQAMLELAILGSLMLLVMGAMMNYGMNADSSHRAVMEAFRQALGLSVNPTVTGGGNYTVTRDRYIPNPSDPFGLGAGIPVSTSASAIRDFDLSSTATAVNQLPRTIFNFQGTPFNCPSSNPLHGPGCLTSGFRLELNVPPNSIKRYDEVYGSSNICDKPACGGGDGICLVPVGAGGSCPSNQQSKNLNIIDPCEAEIMDHDACVLQSRQIVDPKVCEQQCQRGRWPGGNYPNTCASICGVPPMTPVPMTIPWYALDGVEAPGSHAAGTHQWTFLHLDSLFGDIRAMGPQPDATRHVTTTTSLQNLNTPSAATTQSTVDWREDVTRTMVFHPYGDTSGTPATPQIITTPKDEHHTTTQTTPWN